MRNKLRKLGLSLLGLIVTLVVIFAVFMTRTEIKRRTPVPSTSFPVEIPTDESSIAEGRRLIQVKDCATCHGDDLGGHTFIDDPPVGFISGPNLTSGKGSTVTQFSNDDWVRAIRYALDPNGRPLLAMPAGDFHEISKSDLGKMIAALKVLPPVDRESLPLKIGPVAYVLSNLGLLPILFPFEEVDLHAAPADDVPSQVNLEFGRYLAIGCTGCHGPGFGGGHIPGTPPSWPNAKNISSKGRISQWSLDDFKKVLKEGLTPDGHQIDPQFMPWKSFVAMTDTEIHALFLFLKQTPATEDGTR